MLSQAKGTPCTYMLSHRMPHHSEVGNLYAIGVTDPSNGCLHPIRLQHHQTDVPGHGHGSA